MHAVIVTHTGNHKTQWYREIFQIEILLATGLFSLFLLNAPYLKDVIGVFSCGLQSRVTGIFLVHTLLFLSF